MNAYLIETAIAINNKIILVTGNTRPFGIQRVKSLKPISELFVLIKLIPQRSQFYLNKGIV
jgi:hypothetical protein